MSKTEIISGEKRNLLTIIEEAPKLKGRRAISARCDCGKKTVLSLNHFRAGKIKSCGCLRRAHTEKLKRQQWRMMKAKA